MGKLYSVTDIARLIGVCGQTITSWENQDLIPKSARIGRRRKRVWGKGNVLTILTYARDMLNYPVPPRVFEEVSYEAEKR